MTLPPNQLRRTLGPLVRSIVADVQRRVATEVIESRAVERILVVIAGGDELPSERHRRENEAAMAEMERCGNGRNAAMKVARRWSSNPHEQQMLAQRFRRERLKRKKRAEFV
ncbi:hypothetical protein [Bradyrhizobium sp. RDM4]|uniref:hypothetical protein n=1 Tax=Bradyrhizobium sp. RDM4 TaxID=3378765 RepID=UPI0038FC6A4D